MAAQAAPPQINLDNALRLRKFLILSTVAKTDNTSVQNIKTTLQRFGVEMKPANLSNQLASLIEDKLLKRTNDNHGQGRSGSFEITAQGRQTLKQHHDLFSQLAQAAQTG